MGKAFSKTCNYKPLQQPARQCLGGPPCIAVFITRWSNWPAYTPLLLRSLAFNRFIDFYLISDVPPSYNVSLPANVHFYHVPLPEAIERFRCILGLKLRTLSVQQRFSGLGQYGATDNATFSAAKTNDLKPMLGEAFEADLLKGYHWWGHAQEDILFGNLKKCIRPASLTHLDIITPIRKPLNASGVFMLFKNNPSINRLWRQSRDAHRVLSDANYRVFDEWWGIPRIDHFPAIIGRAVDAGRVRIRYGAQSFFSSDLDDDHELIVCWKQGSLFVNSNRSNHQIPCFDTRALGSVGAVRRMDTCIFHALEVKRQPAISLLNFSHQEKVFLQHQVEEFVLTGDGIFASVNSSNDTKLHDTIGTQMPNRGQFKVFRGIFPSRARISKENIKVYLQRLNDCEDIPSNPRNWEDYGGHRAAIRWCPDHARRYVAKTMGCLNKGIRSLCPKTCNICFVREQLLSSNLQAKMAPCYSSPQNFTGEKL